MRRRLRRMSAAEGGFTVVELSVSMFLSALIFGSLVSVIYSFSQQASDSGRNANLQLASRELVAEIVVELRQAEKVTPNGFPVESLDSDKIVFYSDRLEPEGPERIVYERGDCVDGLCNLWLTRFPAVPGSGPWWQFSDVPLEHGVMLQRLPEDQALFSGADWVGDPPSKEYIFACGPSGPECDFPLVLILFRARPTGTSGGADNTYEIEEEVRLRNA